MGVRGEIYSKRVILPNRTYFFNIKENRMGDIYLNIVESKNRETSGYERQSLVLFADDLQEFLQGFDESLHKLEDLVRQKRRSARNEDDGKGRRSERGAYPRSDRSEDDNRGKKSEHGAYSRGDRHEDDGKGRRSERGAYSRNDRHEDGSRGRKSERDAYPRGERKKSYRDSDRAGRSEQSPSGRKRPYGDSERSSQPPRDGKRVVVRKNYDK